ncbi:MAG: putative transcriptional regulator, partial [Saprospiraceae bacterium]
SYKPTRMDKITRIIELKKAGNSIKKISKTLGVSKNTVRKYLRYNERGNDDLLSVNEEPLSNLLLGKKSLEETAVANRIIELHSHLSKELKRALSPKVHNQLLLKVCHFMK